MDAATRAERKRRIALGQFRELPILIASHRPEDIYQLSDRVMVMRRGRRVADQPASRDIHEFREPVVAYMVSRRDDLATGAVD